LVIVDFFLLLLIPFFFRAAMLAYKPFLLGLLFLATFFPLLFLLLRASYGRSVSTFTIRHYSFAFPMFRANKSINLYNFPIHTSSFGVGVEAAIKLATVTIIVTNPTNSIILSLPELKRALPFLNLCL